MEFDFTINTKNGTIDILYQGYNIIAKTLYNEELTQKIIDLLEEETGEKLEEFTELNRW